jgi:hypothetical protein
MIPYLVRIVGSPSRVLPPGVHWALIGEVKERFGWTDRRLELFHGIVRVLTVLQAAGCPRLYLGGSFVTDKEWPNDFDGCWDPSGVQASKLDPVLLDFNNGRRAQKLKYGGEMFPTSFLTETNATFLNFFQIDKHSGQPKGIIGVELAGSKGSEP